MMRAPIAFPRSLTRSAVGLAVLCLAGCFSASSADNEKSLDSAGVGGPGGEMDTGCGANAATVQVGAGADSFVPLANGDAAILVHGPQGGWHVLASARVANMLDVVTITYTVHVLPEDTPVSWNQYGVQLQPFDACTGDYPGMYGYLDVSALAEGDANTPPELLDGRELELRLQVEDADGRAAEASVVVIGQLDTADVDTGE